MVANKKHLHLLSIGKSSPRKKNGGGGPPRIPDRNEKEFVDAAILKCNELVVNLKKNEIRYQKYFNPRLVFKLEFTQNVYEPRLSEALRVAGIQVLAESPNKNGYWIVASVGRDLEALKKKLSEHGDEGTNQYLYLINDLVEIPLDEKVGPGLKREPVTDGESAYLDVEIWSMSNRDALEFIDRFDLFISDLGGRLLDTNISNSFCVIRIEIGLSGLEEVLGLPEIALVDRPIKLQAPQPLDADVGEFGSTGTPSSDAPGILIIDSGILTGHPMLRTAVRDEIDLVDKNENGKHPPVDERSHGTMVAGLALYGDVSACIERKAFIPTIWLYSSRVMFLNENKQTVIDERRLLESQFVDSINWIIANHPECKVVNVSFGNANRRMYRGVQQFTLACLLDELSSRYDLIFVVSTGNSDEFPPLDYPNYLLRWDSNLAKILDPSCSALSITVGAIAKMRVSNTLLPTLIDCPSPITRVGPGLNGMIKPDVVEAGGGVERNDDVVTLNPSSINTGRLFTRVSGTSFSTPRVAHYLAQIRGANPSSSANLAKAILISSSHIPNEITSRIPAYSRERADEAIRLHSIFGYGRPNIEEAMMSSENNLLLVEDSAIRPDAVKFYTLSVPKAFQDMRGEREIAISLCYDPPVNKSKSDYFGVTMEFHLFRNVDAEAVVHQYSAQDDEDESDEEIVPDNLRKNEVTLYPSPSIRKKGAHQKGSRIFTSRSDLDGFDLDFPLILAVVCRKKWVNSDHIQKFAVCARISHSEKIDLYSQIQIQNRERIRIREDVV